MKVQNKNMETEIVQAKHIFVSKESEKFRSLKNQLTAKIDELTQQKIELEEKINIHENAAKDRDNQLQKFKETINMKVKSKTKKCEISLC